MKKISGRCLSGAVQLEVNDNFKYPGYCRRFSGSASSAMAGIPHGEFYIFQGAEAIKRYVKSENTVLAFCQNCGWSSYAEKLQTRHAPLAFGCVE